MTETELHLERLTWPEITQALESGMDSVVFACGAVEQHGPHLPLWVDAEHGTALATAVARELGNTLVAPTVRIGVSPHHMDFPGTITLSEATFEAVCSDYVTSLAHHGFHRVLIVPTHGGNFGPLASMEARLDAMAGANTSVQAYTDLMGMVGGWRQIVEAVSGLGHRVGGHADIAETSLMEFLHPALVRRDRFEPGYAPELTDDVITRIIADGFKSVTPNGILGDPEGATAEIGERCIRELAVIVANHFRC